ncbi:MAG: hypothetical protein RDV41_11850 [Planctomycetota bacterium]|nr:hypothetical protein [Planctomycetota bacterium]
MVVLVLIALAVVFWVSRPRKTPEQIRLEKLADLLHDPFLMETWHFPGKNNALFRRNAHSEELRRAGSKAVPYLMSILNQPVVPQDPQDDARARAMELLSEIPSAVAAETARKFLLSDGDKLLSSRSAWLIGEEEYGVLAGDVQHAFELGLISKEDRMLVLYQLGDSTQSEAILSQLTREIGMFEREYRSLFMTIPYRRIRNSRNLFRLLVPWAISAMDDSSLLSDTRRDRSKTANAILVRMTGVTCPLVSDPRRLGGVDLAELKKWWTEWWNKSKDRPVFVESILDIRRETRGTLDPSVWVGLSGGPFYPPDADAPTFDIEAYEKRKRMLLEGEIPLGP